jgi:hypothetical protein
MGLPVPIFLVAVALSADARTTANLFIFSLLAALIGLIFWFKPKSRGVLPDHWWRVTIRDTDDGFCVSWYPQRWHEMSPSNMPLLWVEPLRFPYIACLILPALALVYETAHGGQGQLEDPLTAALFFAVWLPFLMAVVAVGVVVIKRYAQSNVWFSSDSVFYDPAPSRVAPLGGFFSHGGLQIARRSIRAIRFEPDAVTILGPPFLGLIPMHVRVPHATDTVRERIRDWADTFDIPTHGTAMG